MYSSVDYSVTPRPVYRADGLKLPDIFSEPSFLRENLQNSLGAFPLFQFWGPGASILSSQWIADASREIYQEKLPTLSLIYLPHLDYCLQKQGPDGLDVPKELAKIDDLCTDLIQFYESRNVQVIVLSEYGINAVTSPVAINRELRKKSLLKVREEKGEDHFDAGSSDAFAVADHQIAHVYVKDSSKRNSVKCLLENLEGVEKVLDRNEQKKYGIDHVRSGDLVAIANMDRWFSYTYWLDDSKAPDYARTVDIHRKPGYDPAELFVDPKIRFHKLHIARRLLSKKMGFRYLMDVVPLEGNQVRGSHGRSEVSEEYFPIFATSRDDLLNSQHGSVNPTHIKKLILDHIFDPS